MHCDRNENKSRLQSLSGFSYSSMNRSNSTLNSSLAHSHVLPSSLYLSAGKHTSPADQHARKLSEWGIDTMHDSSPTMVESSEFSSNEQDVFPEDDVNEKLAFSETDEDHIGFSRFETVVSKVFVQNAFDTHSFIDEFQYTIIASQLLTDAIRPLWAAKPKTQHSPLHVGNDRSSIQPSRYKSEIPTKFGMLLVKDRQQFLRKTVPFLPTVSTARRCLVIMKNCKTATKSKQRVFFTLCIGVYLALQQELFHSHYVKFSALIVLQNSVEQLQALDKLLHRLHIRYKELTIYKPIALVQSCHPSGSNLSVIKDVLTASLDLMFYELQAITKQILPLLRKQELFRYCEIYGVNLVDLYFAINSEASGVSEKASRTHLLKKFLLCCFLSVGRKRDKDSEEKELEYQLTLKKIFSTCPVDHQYSEYKRSQVLLHQLHKLSKLLETVHTFLIQYKSHLNDTTSHSNHIQSLQTDHQHDYRTATTLNLIQELQKFLITNNTSTEERTSERMIRKLDAISRLWHQNPSSKERHPSHQNEKRHLSGLNLNVVQSPTLSSSEFEVNQKWDRNKPVLASAVDFKQVEGSGLDTESEQEGDDTITEQIFTYNENIDHKDEFRKLTDEELRNKLNERIMNLAIENKQGKQRLRTKKSFGLLDRNKAVNREKSMIEGRPSHWTKFTSEESIPVLYELRQILEKN
ncbi:LAME_0E04984g1_1 [Lachancea meyersii CBS 8951]|uniref:Inheritance of peroxisomes protein 2 n=1 Tax=Lachancea meyersii CBS 8951 TaxID=1266667 RepID=A0A1G4JH54_9SACH|nr:LAME_0E04984g1_1 [Lachancea meyersii CBS 8951]